MIYMMDMIDMMDMMDMMDMIDMMEMIDMDFISNIIWQLWFLLSIASLNGFSLGPSEVPFGGTLVSMNVPCPLV